jgi:hypothetical protein
MLLAGGFLYGMVIGGLGLGGSLWMIGYALMLAGLTILMTNMVRALWRLGRWCAPYGVSGAGARRSSAA